MPFKYCLNTSTIKPTLLLEKIRLAGKHGFDQIELWINDVYEFVGQGGEVSDVTKALSDHGLTVPCTIAIRGWGEAVGDEYPIILDEVKRRMELAARLGSPLIVATPPREPCDLKQIAARYHDVCEIGRSVGIRATMEYIGFFNSVYKFSQAWQIVCDSGDPDGTVILDAFHNFRGGTKLDELEVIPLEKIAHYHLDDAPAEPPREQQADPDRVMPGDGIIDLKAEIDFLKRKGYNGSISLELFNPGLWQQNPDDVVKEGIEKMRSLLEG